MFRSADSNLSDSVRVAVHCSWGGSTLFTWSFEAFNTSTNEWFLCFELVPDFTLLHSFFVILTGAHSHQLHSVFHVFS